MSADVGTGGPATGLGYRETVRILAQAQKGVAPGAPAYSVLVNRRAGRYLAAGAFRAGLSPNAVSVVSACFTFSGIALLAFAPASPWLGAVIWLVLAVGYAFDSADGQVARLRGGGSPAGEWLDHVFDSAKITSLHLAVLICAHRSFGLEDPAWLLVPIGYCLVAAVAFFTMILTEQLRTTHALRTGGSQPRTPGTRLKSLLLLPTDYGIFCFLFLFLGAPALFMPLYTLFFAANLLHLALALGKWFRELGRLAPPAPGRPAANALSGGNHVG
ncbi:CDP-alcohol phosphatidyltransferase family protein [Arthrobacter ginkgonis]|uniref:CDP-alcohol phosphatidyltransferase family protein n=1 Tax=Arthrobacter ginkgonis TaxID=1630594 RepID=A0ABP7CRF7_9MICC